MKQIKKNYPILMLIYVTILMGCKDKADTLFVSMEANQTGISFINSVVETEALNVMQYEYLYNGGGVGMGDFNNDGLVDIYFTGNTVENKLYINKGNFKFDDITQLAGIEGRKGWKTGVSIADVNGDGLLDIYVCYSGLGTNQDRANQLFINKGIDKNHVPKFVDEAAAYGLDAKGSFSTQAVFFDYDLDGDLDMFLLNHSKTFYSPFYNSTKLRNTRHPFFGNSLYRNDNNHFVNVSESAGIYGSGLNFGLGVAISDFNQDGLPDIYVSNDYDEQDFLYLNMGDGTFMDATKKSFGHISKYSMGNDAADINNDGLVDLITLDMFPEDNYRQKLLKGPDEYDR
ncbi:MAG TPA: VCBS repeat-containing protein, partial [Mariniflexile sp.]